MNVNKLVIDNVRGMAQSSTSHHKFPPVIELNVGGCCYTTSLLTLTKHTDTMLAAMFSGCYHLEQDSAGRYFIDADGESFLYILNYLRYGQLPAAANVDILYRDALYFGLGELVEILERHPVILAKKKRKVYKCQFMCYTDVYSKVLNHISNLDLSPKEDTSSVYIVVKAAHTEPESGENEPPNNDRIFVDEENNRCQILNNQDQKLTADIAAKIPDLEKAKDFIKCLCYDLTSHGFVVTQTDVGVCNNSHVFINAEKERIVSPEPCKHQLYKLCFYWWK